MNMKIYKGVVLILSSTVLLFSFWDIRNTELGQWEVAVSNFGKFGQSIDFNYGALWPRGSGHNYIYGSGMWYGCIAPNGDTLVTIGYGPHGAETEFAPGIPYSNPGSALWHVHMAHDIDEALPVTSPADADAVYNDFDIQYHTPGDTRPIGMTINQKVMIWPKNWADDVVFLKFTVRNDTTCRIDKLYGGFCMDYDIGNESGFGNDLCGIDVANKVFYGWQQEPEPGWGERPGMIGLLLLDTFSLTSFKRFALNLEPNVDPERYLALAGYNFKTGQYEPYDTVVPTPDDQRVLMSTGMFSLEPTESVCINWALIASRDSQPPGQDFYYKVRKARDCFNAGFHAVEVLQPDGGETVDGNFDINYTATSITGNPLSVDFYLFSENGIDTIAIGQANTGSFSWPTGLFPDGVCNRVAIMVYDTVTFGGDASDGFFTIDNPGNSPPYIRSMHPRENDTLQGACNILWFCRDPEFGDSLLIDIFYQNDCDSILQTVALGEVNDSNYAWFTCPYRNGPGCLILQATDGQFTVAETIRVILRNEVVADTVTHVSGLNNCVDLDVYVHDPSKITGHTYRLEFLEYKKMDSLLIPEYGYRITDLNNDSVILDDYSLKEGYYGQNPYGYGIEDNSPIIDGFSIHAATISENTILSSNFRNDSVRVVQGSYPDSLSIINPHVWWAYRGAKLQMEWYQKASGAFSMHVNDLDYGDTIPYKPYNRNGTLNPDSAFGWCFNRIQTGVPSDTFIPGYTNMILVCGSFLRIRDTLCQQQPGDRWVIYPGSYAPPIQGNVYTFSPENMVGASKKSATSFAFGFQVCPVPSRNNLSVQYTVSKKQQVNITVFDIAGRRVRQLVNRIVNSGFYHLDWRGDDDMKRRVAAGVYFIRLETADRTETKKVLMIK